MLKREKKIGAELIEKLMNRRHDGFSTHACNRIARDDLDGQAGSNTIYHAKRFL
ncbi:hypothetical protein [Desulforhabdus amnigena]|uniref:Uncharacterized protein n=1 Tax=Desulforhabdus amnigena TaxID=40218 RepID=A0A9W6FTH6_9BACT|nr:hypothetical protein [Desulforhabdus amnigena]NLJ29939.1 hypothetical protein [Deltaproteobacteria bacterium]GLI33920.1 hypothetical protein DAMNIGENAA_13530 [Desulforhabdus amnigena]